jgi:hypothetical protein
MIKLIPNNKNPRKYEWNQSKPRGIPFKMRQMAPTVESTNTFELSLVVTNLLNEMFGILMFLKKFNFF